MNYDFQGFQMFYQTNVIRDGSKEKREFAAGRNYLVTSRNLPITGDWRIILNFISLYFIIKTMLL